MQASARDHRDVARRHGRPSACARAVRVARGAELRRGGPGRAVPARRRARGDRRRAALARPCAPSRGAPRDPPAPAAAPCEQPWRRRAHRVRPDVPAALQQRAAAVPRRQRARQPVVRARRRVDDAPALQRLLATELRAAQAERFLYWLPHQAATTWLVRRAPGPVVGATMSIDLAAFDGRRARRRSGVRRGLAHAGAGGPAARRRPAAARALDRRRRRPAAGIAADERAAGGAVVPVADHAAARHLRGVCRQPRVLAADDAAHPLLRAARQLPGDRRSARRLLPPRLARRAACAVLREMRASRPAAFAAATPAKLSNEEVERALRDALRHWHDRAALATNPLVASRAVRAALRDGEAPEAALQRLLLEAAQALAERPRDAKFWRALELTYVQASGLAGAAPPSASACRSAPTDYQLATGIERLLARWRTLDGSCASTVLRQHLRLAIRRRSRRSFGGQPTERAAMFHRTSFPPTWPRALVLGASIAGLLAARILSERFAEVVLLERDALPDGAAPRKGTPHGGPCARPAGARPRDHRAAVPRLHRRTGRARRRWSATSAPTRRSSCTAALRQRRRRRTGVAASRLGDRGGVAPARACAVRRAAADRHRRRSSRSTTAAAGASAACASCAATATAAADASRRPGARLHRPRLAHAGLAARLGLRGTGGGARDVVVGLRHRLLPSRTAACGRHNGDDLPGHAGGTDAAAYSSRRSPRSEDPPRWVVARSPAMPATTSRRRSRRCASALRASATLSLVRMTRDAELLGAAEALRLPGKPAAALERLARFPERLPGVGRRARSFNPVYGQGMTVAACEALALRDALAYTGCRLRSARASSPRRQRRST